MLAAVRGVRDVLQEEKTEDEVLALRRLDAAPHPVGSLEELPCEGQVPVRVCSRQRPPLLSGAGGYPTKQPFPQRELRSLPVSLLSKLTIPALVPVTVAGQMRGRSALRNRGSGEIWPLTRAFPRGAGRTRTSDRRIMSLTASVLPRPCGAVPCRPVQVRTLSWGGSCRPVLSCGLPFGSTAGSTAALGPDGAGPVGSASGRRCAFEPRDWQVEMQGDLATGRPPGRYVRPRQGNSAQEDCGALAMRIR